MRRQTIRKLLNINFIKRIVKRSRLISLPGFGGASLYLVSRLFFLGIKNGSLTTRASALSFNFFLALFPSVIFLFTVIPYIPIADFQNSLFNLIQTLLPKSAFEAAEGTILDIINNPHGGLLSFGFISALLFSTNGFNAMISSFNETFHDIETRTVIEQRIIALLMVVVSTILISLAITLIVITELFASNYIHIGFIDYLLIHFGKYIILILLCLTFISFNYYMGPKRKQGFKFISPGSIFATVFIIISSLVFAYYVNQFGNYNKLYGSIGTLIVFMLWIYIVSFILLLGFDLNVSINIANKKLKNK